MATINVKEHECDIAFAAELMEYYTDAGDPVFLSGTYGIGKSEAVKQLGVKRGRKVIDLRLNIREPVDLRGIPVPDMESGTTRWFVPDELPQIERDGEFGYLFLDELNTSSPQMMAVAMQLVLDRKVGDYILPPGWVIVAAGNRVSDRASANRMPTALKDRFAWLNVVTSLPAWCDWATKNDIAPMLVAFHRFRQGENGGAGLLHVMPKGDERMATPRSWAKCSKHVNAPKRLRMRLFAGLVGDSHAAEFDSFIDLYNSIGNLADIVKNPTTAKLPQDASIRYATMTALARMATKANIDAIVTYSKRLGHRESEMLVLHDATVRDESLKNTKAYATWAVEFADLTIQ